jgi:putative flavoprotein involved in K+ transport
MLLGHLQGFADGRIVLAPDLKENLTRADKFEADFIKAIDDYIAKMGLPVLEESLPLLRDGFDVEVVTELDLKFANITNMVWATSYKFDFSLVKLPIFDSDGYPIQSRGVTNYPGLYFVGLPWLHNAKSGLIYGVGDDAAYIAQKITTDDRAVRGTSSPPDTPEKNWLSHDFCCS